ncbi:hypothetical protein D3C71_1054910 [compost metagenome]
MAGARGPVDPRCKRRRPPRHGARLPGPPTAPAPPPWMHRPRAAVHRAAAAALAWCPPICAHRGRRSAQSPPRRRHPRAASAGHRHAADTGHGPRRSPIPPRRGRWRCPRCRHCAVPPAHPGRAARSGRVAPASSAARARPCPATTDHAHPRAGCAAWRRSSPLPAARPAPAARQSAAGHRCWPSTGIRPCLRPCCGCRCPAPLHRARAGAARADPAPRLQRRSTTPPAVPRTAPVPTAAPRRAARRAPTTSRSSPER